MAISLARPGRGRPQKFGRPARAVTLTLPEDVLTVLTRLDDDVSRAVVRIVQPLTADVVPHAPAELSKHGDAAVIVIRPVAALERIPGVTLVPMPDGRALISLDDSMTTYEFELKLRDALDDPRHRSRGSAGDTVHSRDPEIGPSDQGRRAAAAADHRAAVDAAAPGGQACRPLISCSAFQSNRGTRRARRNLV